MQTSCPQEDTILWKNPPKIDENTMLGAPQEIFKTMMKDNNLLAVFESIISKELPQISKPCNIYKSREDILSSFIQEMAAVAEDVVDITMKFIAPSVKKFFHGINLSVSSSAFIRNCSCSLPLGLFNFRDSSNH